MASTEPWISPLLRSALEHFIAGNYESSQFSFDYDSSSKRLEIKARLDEARTLRIVELPISQGRPEPLGSDGAYALPFTGDDSCGRLQTGQVLLAHEIEFILGDHFDPVRVEICPRSLKVVEHSDVAMQTCSLPLIMSQEASMQALLQEALRVSGREPKAVDEDSDREEILSQPEESTVSQAVFQTQAPLPCPMHAATKPTQVQRAGPLSRAEQRHKDTALNLLRPKDRDGQLLPVSEAECSPARIQLLRQPVVHSEENAVHDPVPASSVLSQRPLCSPADSAPKVSMSRSNIIAEPGPAKSPTKLVSMPLRLQRWSQQCVANRYLPRRISKISKSQSALLDSDNSYSPPLPGRDFRPGTVPLDLLKKIIAQADRLAMAPEEDSSEQHRENAEPDEQHEEAGGEKEIADNLAFLDSSQFVGSDDWPESSPEWRRTELPPDSPSNASSQLAESQSEDPSVVEAALPVPEMIEAALNQAVAPRLSGAQAQTSTQSEVSQSRVETNCISDDSAALMSSGHQQTLTVSPALQIKRTPQTARAIHLADTLPSKHSASEQLRLSGSSHEFIHSTYDCMALKHPVLAEKVPNAPASSPGPSKSLVAINIAPAVKRPAHNDMQELREAKRFKISSKGRGPDSIDPAYNEVIEANRARRIAELAPLAEKRPDPQPMDPSPAPSDVFHPRNTSVAAKSGTDTSRRLSDSDLAGGSSTPITVPSHRSNRRVSPLGSSGFVPKTLFDHYRSVYQDYQGDEPSFENAVSLLKRLRDDNKGAHPFLFDDFIFHHYHSYRDYLLKVASSSEDPVPYGQYYDLHIQSPGHSQKVVTLATLAWLSSHPGVLPRERPYVQVERIGVAQSSKSLIGIQKSAGKHVSSQYTSPQPLLDDDIDDMRADHRMGEAVQQNDVDPFQQSSVQSWVEQIRGASPELGTPDIDRSRDDVRPVAPTRLHAALEKLVQGRAIISPSSSFPGRSISKRSTSAPHQMQRCGLAAGTKVQTSTPTDKHSKPKQPGWWNKDSASPFSNLTPRSTPLHGSQRESKPQFTDFYKWRRLRQQ